MRKSTFLLLFLLLFSSIYATFEIRTVFVDLIVDETGSTKVQEIVKFDVTGDVSQSKYIAGLNNNELSFWSTTTDLSDLRVHLNSNVVNIDDFRIIPQPLRNCNSALNKCLGEIKMEYIANPYYSSDTNEIVEGTGLFGINKYKPRTTRFSVHEDAFLFETTEVEDITRINDYTTLSLTLPQTSTVLEVNPIPSNLGDLSFPTTINEYSWQNTILVKFSFIYEIEQGLDEEILEFFSNIYTNFNLLIFGSEGFSTILIVLILFSFYIALTSLKKKKR